MLRIMDQVCAKLESGQPVDTGHLEQIVEITQVFADQCHHAKEEDLLFVAMEQAGPIGVMLAEHTKGRSYVKAMGEAIAAYKADDESAAANIVENARGYIALLTQHIQRRQHPLPDGRSRTCGHKAAGAVENIRRDRVRASRPGRHEAFHQLHDLDLVYLQDE